MTLGPLWSLRGLRVSALNNNRTKAGLRLPESRDRFYTYSLSGSNQSARPSTCN